MLTLVTIVSRLVRKAPIFVIILTLLTTMGLGYFIQFTTLAEGNEGFAPDAPELTVLQEIPTLFGAENSGQIMQVILSAPEGGTILSPEGRAAADAVVAAVENSVLGSQLQAMEGRPSVISPFVALDGMGGGPGVQVVIASDTGDVLTPEGVGLAAEVEAAIQSSLGNLLDTEGAQPPLVSFSMPIALGGAGGSDQVVYLLSGPDVVSSQGLSAVMAFEQALRASPLGELLAPDTPFQPAMPHFLMPVMNVMAAGGVAPDASTDEVKAAYLEGLSLTPAAFQAQVTSMLVSDADLDVPSATAGAISISFAEPVSQGVIDGVGQLAASIPVPDGFAFALLPDQGTGEAPALDTPAAIKEAWSTGAESLPEEFAGFLSFLFSGDFDPDSLTASKGMVSATLTAEPTAEQLVALDEALAAINAPAGYRIGHLPQGADQETFLAAFQDRLDFIPVEQAGFVTALLPASADIEAGTASDALMVVFLESPAPDDEFAFMDDQATVGQDLASLDLGGYEARAFGFALLLAEGADIQDEVARMFATAGAIIVTILFFVYWAKPHGRLSFLGAARRTVGDVLITLLGIGMAIGWMQGLGVLLGPDYLGLTGYSSELTQMLPVLLIGLGVDYGIHMTSRFREEAGQGADVDHAISRSIRTVGIALVLATITTVIGFLTNLVSPVGALKDFGILAAAGIVSAFVIMLTFVPAVRLLLDRWAERSGRWPATDLHASKERLLPTVVGKTSWLARRIPVVTILVAVLLGALGGYGATKLETRFSFLDFLPQDSPIIETYNLLTDEFGGGFGETTQVVIRGEDLATPAIHNAAAAAYANLADTEDVVTLAGQASAESPFAVIQSLIDPTLPTFDAEVAAAAEAVGLQEDFTVPEDADVAGFYGTVANLAPDAWATVVHSESGVVKDVLWNVSTQAGEFSAGALRAGMGEDVQPIREAGVDVIVTSDAILGDVISEILQSSQLESLMITIAAATLVLMINFLIESRRPMLGVLTMIPVVLVVAWTFGMMALTGIPFSPITATISALAIGIGVPYTIHITHRFLEDRLEAPDVETAVQSTAVHTGGALAGSAFTTLAGFGSLMTSSLKPFQQFGAVTAYAIGFALLASILVLPSMLVIWDRWHRRRGDDVLGGGRFQSMIDADDAPATGRRADGAAAPNVGDREIGADPFA